MSCPKTRHLLTEYFDEDQSPLAREEMERHLQSCQTCSGELEQLLAVQSGLDGWQEQRVPHWDRGLQLYRSEHRVETGPRANWLTQWFPTAASLAMLVLLLFNVSMTSDQDGFSIAFGASAVGPGQERIDEQLRQFAARQQQRQEETLQLYLARLDARRDANNLRLIQAVMEQAEVTAAESFEQMYSYFEQQRQLDMENVQVGYQQLLDSDFETLRTMQQLASYIQFQGEIR